MSYLRTKFRRFYNFMLAVRHRTGRTEQLLIAMNGEAQHHAGAQKLQLERLRQDMQKLRQDQVIRFELLFQSMKQIEPSPQRTAASGDAQVNEIASKVYALMGDWLESERERADMMFQSHKAFELEMKNAIQTLETRLEQGLADLHQSCKGDLMSAEVLNGTRADSEKASSEEER